MAVMFSERLVLFASHSLAKALDLACAAAPRHDGGGGFHRETTLPDPWSVGGHECLTGDSSADRGLPLPIDIGSSCFAPRRYCARRGHSNTTWRATKLALRYPSARSKHLTMAAWKVASGPSLPRNRTPAPRYFQPLLLAADPSPRTQMAARMAPVTGEEASLHV